jgi:hypothetical protein
MTSIDKTAAREWVILLALAGSPICMANAACSHWLRVYPRVRWRWPCSGGAVYHGAFAERST